MFTMMEDIVLRRMLSKLSWDGGDGIFSPGKTENSSLMFSQTCNKIYSFFMFFITLFDAFSYIYMVKKHSFSVSSTC